MELEIYDALQAAGVPNDKARSAVESINKAIDQRYSLHAQQLATRGDVEQVRADLEKSKGQLTARIAETEANLVKWLVGTALVTVGTIAALITRLPT